MEINQSGGGRRGRLNRSRNGGAVVSKSSKTAAVKGADDQLAALLGALSAIVNGDFSARLPVNGRRGMMGRIAEQFNRAAELNERMTNEIVRVERTVRREGRMTETASLADSAGGWSLLLNSVNSLISGLVQPSTEVARVISAVAKGDLTQKMALEIDGRPVEGEFLRIGMTVNAMVDQLSSFAAEVTRVAREVGTDGKLGGQAEVKGVSGIWKDLTDNVNLLANNLTAQVRNIAEVTTAVAKGNLSKKITVDAKGEVNELKDTINTMVDQLRSFAAEVSRVAREVATEGRLGGQAQVPGVSGTWKDLTDNVNELARNLTDQVRNIAKVTTAVANGDLSQKITVDVKGEILELKNTINVMVDQLRSFASEVTRVAREVGTEGKLGGQAVVPGVSGTWKDLTDNVNFMASNLTTQVRGIVKVVTAVANGDLSQKLIGVEAKGEIAALADTINSMTDTLGIFADQVSTVAREVGIEGELGGQAKVPGAAGTWRDLTDNVNQLASNLTNQVRAISEVAAAVIKGDLTRSIKIEAAGEVASLSDTINQMIVNLRETTQKNTEQDWLKTNLARFSSMMQGQKDLETVSRLIMSELTPLVSAHYGAFFLMDTEGGAPILKLTNTYGYRERKGVPNRFRLGESLVGQCAIEKKSILLTRVPPDYIQISSGLGEAPPLNIIVLPILFEGDVRAVIELASFHPFSAIHQIFLDQLSESIGVVLNMIIANMRTEQLLRQSQQLAQELQNQSAELTGQQQALRITNAALERQALELEEKARLLEEQNSKVEEKNREVEQARKSLEDKAGQLALVSKYKSEFLANMSHELRTPLNSLLVLAKVLSENKHGNLTEKQLEYARTIHTSGNDLLRLINEVLDLSKMEAGKLQIEPGEVEVGEVARMLEKNFRPLADEKSLGFFVEVSDEAPPTIESDPQRLEQVMRNLLSNALKFTEAGWIKLRIAPVDLAVTIDRDSLREGDRAVAFSVIDTGIGIARDKQKIIFEAFQQAEGGTGRKYGGTGLGLSISREIARALGGTIEVFSSLGQGSTFTLYLPLECPHTTARPADPAATNGTAIGAGGDEAGGTLEIIGGDGTHVEMVEPVTVRNAGDSADLPASPAEGQALEGRKALVVDDDSRNIFAIKTLLERYGMKALEAADGRAAIALIERNPDLDVVLMDIMMPEMDGYETIRRIRGNSTHRHLPVIAVTAKAFKEDRERCIEVGASDYLAKPVDESTLVRAIKSALGDARAAGDGPAVD